MLTQTKLIVDAKRFFARCCEDVHARTGECPTLYAVHVRPKENAVKSIPPMYRLDYVEEILDRVIKRVQTRLVNKPTATRNIPLSIHSRNYIESKTRRGDEDIHHSHGVWLVHPYTTERFHKLLVPFNRELLNAHQETKYRDKILYSLDENLLGSVSDKIHSIMIEEVYDLELILDYCTKNSHTYGPFNEWGTFDTPTLQKNKSMKNTLSHSYHAKLPPLIAELEHIQRCENSFESSLVDTVLFPAEMPQDQREIVLQDFLSSISRTPGYERNVRVTVIRNSQ